MNVSETSQLIIAISGAIGAAGFMYRKVVSPLAQTLVTVEEAIPVLTQISKEFKNNSGSSFKDYLDKRLDTVTHDAAQTRAALGLYIRANDTKLNVINTTSAVSVERLTQIEAALNALRQTLAGLNPPPQAGRRGARRLKETPDTDRGVTDAGT